MGTSDGTLVLQAKYRTGKRSRFCSFRAVTQTLLGLSPHDHGGLSATEPDHLLQPMVLVRQEGRWGQRVGRCAVSLGPCAGLAAHILEWQKSL